MNALQEWISKLDKDAKPIFFIEVSLKIDLQIRLIKQKAILKLLMKTRTICFNFLQSMIYTQH